MEDLRSFSGKIESIQLLRAVAAVGVAFRHIQFLYDTGINFSCGVSLFFAISAFLMMYTTQKKPDYFVVKRLIRIVPLYWIMTILTYLAAKILPALMPSTQADLKSLLCSLFFIPYARKALQVDLAVRPLVGPGWTLYYELYFTVLFALSMKISHKYRGLISGLALAVIVALGKLLPGRGVIFEFFTSAYYVYFIIGIAAFYILRSLNGVQVRKPVKVSLAGFAIFAGGGLIFQDILPSPRWLFSCLLCGFILVAVVTALKNVKLPRWIVKAGDVSFSFYLIHYYVIVAVGKVFDLNHPSAEAWIGVAVVLIVSEVLAIISYNIIEVRLTKKLCAFLPKKKQMQVSK